MITISTQTLADGHFHLMATRLVDGEVQVVADRVGCLDEIQKVAVEVIGMEALLDAVAAVTEPAPPVN